MKEKLKPCGHCKCTQIILDSFEPEKNLLPTEIVYSNHCGVTTPEMQRGRAVELWNIESNDEEVSPDGKAQPARELGINRETVGLYLRLAKGANPAISTT